MSLAFVQPAVSLFHGVEQAPALRGASIPTECADLGSSFTATSMMAFGATGASVFALAGERQKRRGGNRCRIVKCRAVPTAADVAYAKEKADLLSWAAETLEGKGDHRAEEMADKAERKMHIYASMKAAFEKGVPVAPPPAPEEPASAAPAEQTAADAETAVTKEEVALARERADLVVWAAKTLKAKGLPQYAEMQEKADRKVKEYESLKSAFETGVSSATLAASPEASAAPVPPPPEPEAPLSGHKPSAAELKQFKKEADLMVWAAQTLKDKGAPQYAEMQAKADKKMNTYESLKALAEA